MTPSSQEKLASTITTQILNMQPKKVVISKDSNEYWLFGTFFISK